MDVRVLIAGCGYVGIELGRILGAAGHEVWGLRRDPRALPEPIRPVAADLRATDLARTLPNVDTVVYATAADATTPEAYRAAYVEGTVNLMSALAARDLPIRRFVFVSSTAVWGGGAGEWVDEDSPTSPDGFRGEIVLEGERRVLSGPFPALVLRMGGIYGPGRTRLIERVRTGEARCPDLEMDDDATWTNRIHRDDAAGCLAHLLSLENPTSLYIGVDDEPARLCDVYTFVAELLQVPPPVRVRGPGLGTSRRRSSKRCSNRRLREAGYSFRFRTFREGYRAVVEGSEFGAGSHRPGP